MKDRRKRNGAISWSTFFWCTLLIVFLSIFFTTLTFSSIRSFYIPASFHQKWRTSAMKAKIDDTPPTIAIRDIVMLPDEALIFLYYPPSFHFYSQNDLRCVYFSADSSRSNARLTQLPIQVHVIQPREQIVRCPIHPRGYTVSLATQSNGPIPTRKDSSIHSLDPLVYEAFSDRDNTTVVFVKGLNLRPERLAQPSRFQCVYGWDLKNPKFLLSSDVISVAQEIVRCQTPKSVLIGQAQAQAQAQAESHSVKVSIKVEGTGIFPSIAKPGPRPPNNPAKRKKAHKLCLCTMLRNQAKFMKEWVMYHAKIGVQRWFIYDNNSDDDLDKVIEFLQSGGYNITRHLWPWVKTQEAGFAHCALRARATCQWVGFIDVDEFFNVKVAEGLQHVISSHAKLGKVGEIRTPCYSFGPSGLKEAPREGVTVGYTCRLLGNERHKSIVKPEALNQSLINVVHHFHLREPFVAVDVEKRVMVINHYKYQVWKVFKEKFYRRVATYVADWREKQNVGSKDRAPGLGTRAVEPADWSNRFCEVKDMRLRNWVLRNFMDRRTHLLPWQPEYEEHQHQHQHQHQIVKKRRRRKDRGHL